MNPLISEVTSYPFDRLRNLLGKSSPKKNKNDFINLSIGEPKQNSNKEILKILKKNENLFSQYPPIESIRELTDSYKTYLNKRFGVSKIENENILNLGGTREGTFSVIQSLFNRSLKSKKPFIFMPNPFYQIYGGASLFAGAISKHINLNEEKDFILDLDSVSESQWQKCQLLIMCSPSNPTGSVMEKEEILKVIKLSRKYNFYIVSDECYIDIYRKKPPESFIQVSIEKYGNMKNIVSLHSLSKRSNLPGFRSGMICGDKKLINNFKKYRALYFLKLFMSFLSPQIIPDLNPGRFDLLDKLWRETIFFMFPYFSIDT